MRPPRLNKTIARGLRRVCEGAEADARLLEDRCRLFGYLPGDRRHQEAAEARAAAGYLRKLLEWFDGGRGR